MDVGIDTGTEQVEFGRQLLFSSAVEGTFYFSDHSMLNRFLDDSGIVATDFSYNINALQPSKGIVNKQTVTASASMGTVLKRQG